MSRHTPRRLRWSGSGGTAYRWRSCLVRYDKGAWWAYVAYQISRNTGGEAPSGGQVLIDRLGPFRRPRNAMLAAEERVLILERKHPGTISFEGSPSPDVLGHSHPHVRPLEGGNADYAP